MPKTKEESAPERIEINSPHYTSLRDGNRVAIPEEYVPKDYKEPAFSVREFRASDTWSGEPDDGTSMKVRASHS